MKSAGHKTAHLHYKGHNPMSSELPPLSLGVVAPRRWSQSNLRFIGTKNDQILPLTEHFLVEVLASI